MSTEKSRDQAVANRLAREKKLRNEIIDKFANQVGNTSTSGSGKKN